MKRFPFKKLIIVRIEGSRRSINYAHTAKKIPFMYSQK
jgi:hypothetical protein